MDKLSFKAFNHTLVAICYLVTLAAGLAAIGKYSEAIGVGAAVTGLIGLIRFPNNKNVQIDQPSDKPVPVEEQTNG